jgi:F-box/WD-40 domain protein 7
MHLYDKYLFASSHNKFKVWDLETLTCVKTITTTVAKSIYSLAVAGNMLLGGTWNNNIMVWSLKNNSFEFLKSLYEHQACVLSLAVSGQLLFSGSYDTTIKVWSLETLQVIDTLHHSAKVEALIATDKYLISGGTDGSIKIWTWKYHA